MLKKKEFVENLAKRIGDVQEVQITLPNGFVGQFIRVRVKLDVNKSLLISLAFQKVGRQNSSRSSTRNSQIFAILVGRWDIGMRSVELESMMFLNLSGDLLFWLHGEEEELAGTLGLDVDQQMEVPALIMDLDVEGVETCQTYL